MRLWTYLHHSFEIESIELLQSQPFPLMKIVYLTVYSGNWSSQIYFNNINQVQLWRANSCSSSLRTFAKVVAGVEPGLPKNSQLMSTGTRGSNRGRTWVRSHRGGLRGLSSTQSCWRTAAWWWTIVDTETGTGPTACQSSLDSGQSGRPAGARWEGRWQRCRPGEPSAEAEDGRHRLQLPQMHFLGDLLQRLPGQGGNITSRIWDISRYKHVSSKLHWPLWSAFQP